VVRKINISSQKINNKVTYMTKQNIIVNGKTYAVEIGEIIGSTVQVTVDGESYEVVLPGATATMPKTVVQSAPITPVTKPATAPAPTAAKQAAAPPSSGSGNDIIAPMPGAILEVHVKIGEQVTKGQIVISLEAMKMRNAIRSSKDGVVSNIYVNVGQKVKYNEVLVQID
jgi:glutaconyl-CoA/methylmalonyl-CoA decarboxylase subunit gamma